MFLACWPCFDETNNPTLSAVRNFFFFVSVFLLWSSISFWVILSRVLPEKTRIGFWSWIALFIAWNFPSVITRRVSADLSSADELQPRMWAL